MISLCMLAAPVTALAAGELPPAGMFNYCSQPPLTAAAPKPNVLLMLDNSASMYDPAYTEKFCSESSQTCNSSADCPSGQSCEAHQYCLDSSYRNAATYTGYFDPGAIYSYDFSKGYFVAGATLPSAPCSSGSCAATEFLYVQMGETPTSYPYVRPVTAFAASGNFLNWLSMSKLDLEKRALTGGKFVPDPSDSQTDRQRKRGWLQGESRGCQGSKRFVKLVDGLPITFAVRGPLLTDYYTDGALWEFNYDGGGAARIEIYDRTYNRGACLGAVDAWRGRKKELLVAQTDLCMGNDSEPGVYGTMPTSGKIFKQAIVDCYSYLFNDVPLYTETAIQKLCEGKALGLFNSSQYKSFTRRQWSAMDTVCSNNSLHPPNNGEDTGFFGICATLSQYAGACYENDAIAYCKQMISPLVQDPWTAAGSGIASFITAAGASSLGGASGKLNVRVYLPSPPSGLVQQFAGTMNFGAMAINNGADAAECSSGKVTCLGRCAKWPSRECGYTSDCAGLGPCTFSDTDGGRVISYLNDAGSPLGDYGTGLVGAIDALTAANWSPLAESFYSAIGYFAHRNDLRLSAADFDAGKPAPSQYGCQKNNILIISDGTSSVDSHPAMEALAALYAQPSAELGQDGVSNCPPYGGSRSLDDLAWLAAHRNIKTLATAAPASGELPASQDQSVTTHVVFTGSSNGAPGECDPQLLMERTAQRGGGIFVNNTEPAALYGTLQGVLQQIAAAGSGTDPAILSTGNGNGAVYLAEQYHSQKSFDGGNSAAAWTGEMLSLWYYIDPFLQGTGTGSTIREDSDGDLTLKLRNDLAVSFEDDTATLFYDGNGDGLPDGATQSVSHDAVKALWRAGVSLWKRPAADRTIYTQVDGRNLTSFSSLADHSPDSAIALLQASGSTHEEAIADAKSTISYVTGADSAGLRNRALTIPAGTIAGVAAGTNVWKLGDIVSSTPQIHAGTPLGGYNLSAPAGYNDLSYRSFVSSKEYKSRGIVFAGANDGMLHAFKMGVLNGTPSGESKASLLAGEGETTADFGREQWAFIPKNALPYLAYLREPLYQHIYYVDGPLILADATIGDTNGGGCVKASYWQCSKQRAQSVLGDDQTLDPQKNTWRTVLVGGMGLGGASGTCSSPADCVPTPIADPADSSKRLGYSSYFALDVTDADRPSLLWEFSHPDLGYSTTGPAIVRVGGPEVNGRWFAVFGSGPTGPIRDGQFLGHSGKELKFFVVDLRSGALVSTISTGISDAFAGSLRGGAVDVDRRNPSASGYYQDDVIYVGYVAKDQVAGTWTRGGVGRIIIDNGQLREGEPSDDKVRNIWHWSRVMGYDPVAAPDDTTGPVTTGIARLVETRAVDTRRKGALWLYFGTGRYFYRFGDRDGDPAGNLSRDDWSGRRALYGIKDPCYYKTETGAPFDPGCSEAVTGITDQTSSVSAVSWGWQINLLPAADSNGAERVITTPVSTTTGAVFFASYQPTATPCLSGNSYLWGVSYDSGNALAGIIKGKAIMQLSSGRAQEVPLANPGQRRSGPIAGRPVGLKIVSNSGLKPLRKIIHIQER